MAVRELSIKELGIVAGGTSQPTVLPGVTVIGVRPVCNNVLDDFIAFFYSNYCIDNDIFDEIEEFAEKDSARSIESLEVQNMMESLLKLFEAAYGGTTGFDAGLSQIDFAELSAELLVLTASAALNDINTFNAIGSHQIYSQGSLVDWNAANINWSLYNENGTASADETFSNWVNAMIGTGH